jgi:release factor glutamine methyltransferase
LNTGDALPSSVATLLREAAQFGLEPREARILLAHALQWPRTALITREQHALDPAAPQRYRELAARRLAGEPIAQLLGQREFYGLAFDITPAVLIPRPETELLVEQGLQACAEVAAPRLLDLGTGSGAIAIALAHSRADAQVTATERSAAALAVARANGAKLLGARSGGPLQWLEGDWYGALASAATQRFHVIVSNPPYIRADDVHLERGDLRFEPRAALTDEADGLTALRIIVAGASAHLLPDGALWLEHGYDQAQAVAGLLRERGFAAVQSHADLAGIARITGGIWRAGDARA